MVRVEPRSASVKATTREDIEKYNLREVRIDTYQKWYEMIINPITSIVSIQRRTLIVEGNP